MNFNTNLIEIKEDDLLIINGGDWFGGDFINAIFECGRKLGNAIGNVIWG